MSKIRNIFIYFGVAILTILALIYFPIEFLIVLIFLTAFMLFRKSKIKDDENVTN